MASIPESLLEIGLAALKQKNYSEAITHLEAVCQTRINQTAQAQAKMGLVVAYAHTGKIRHAQLLCQDLSHNTDLQVKEWVARNQAQLRRYTSEQIGEENSLIYLPRWRQAGRAKKWRSLGAINFLPLWLLQVGTVVLLFLVIRELLKFTMMFTNNLLVALPYLEPVQAFYQDATLFVLLISSILISLSPWLLDRLLQLFYGLQPLSTTTLSIHSPEAIRVLQRYCRQQRWSEPTLAILPTSAPVALTYGNLPRTARIVVSQGLLEQLADDEIATIYATQLGHITQGDFVVMSLVILVTQIPYTIYQQLSQWGDKSNLILRLPVAALTSLTYGVWFLLCKAALWLSQLRVYYSDRLAVEITGNPNALTRSLLKIAIGIADDIKKQGRTSWLLESFNMLTPMSYQQAITLGSLHSSVQFEPILAWDCLNPYRQWLNINNTHPLIGTRIERLNQIAHHWHLETELSLSFHSPTPLPSFSLFLMQGAPCLGIIAGLVFGCLTWLWGGVGILLGIAQLAWMYGDWSLINGCLLIGFSIGTLIRINSFFPDLKPANIKTNPDLPSLVANHLALPIDSQPVCIQGQLLGRCGISNLLGQDLILHSPTGLVKLHALSWSGCCGNALFSKSLGRNNLSSKQVVATGWFRRGATVWFDIDTLKTQAKEANRSASTHRPQKILNEINRSAHPVWSTLLASVAAVWGFYLILSDGV